MKIQNKLIIYFLIVLLVPISVVSFVTVRNSQLNLENKIIDEINTIADNRKIQFEQFFHNNTDIINIIANRTTLVDEFARYNKHPTKELQDVLNNALKDSLNSQNDIGSISLINRSGIIIASTDINLLNTNISNESYFIKQTTGPYFTEKNGTLTLSFIASVFNNGELIGLTKSTVNNSIFSEITADRAGLGKTGEVLLAILGPDKNPLFITNRRFEGQAIDTASSTIPMRAALNKQEKIFNPAVDYRGINVVAATRYLSEVSAGLVVKIDQSEANEPLRNVLMTTVVITIFAILLAFFVALFLSRNFSDPIKKLTSITKKISEGNLKTGFSSELLSERDEIGVLAVNFKSMMDNVSHSYEETKRKENKLVEAQRIGKFGNFDWDARSNTIFWSDEYYRIYGFELGTTPPNYEDHLKTYTPESAARLDAAVKNSMATGEPYTIDLEHVRPDGVHKWITARGEVKRDANGTIIGLHGTAQDITELKEAETNFTNTNRALRMLSTTNESLIHATNEEELHQKICNIMVDEGGCRLAWIGHVEKDETNKINVIAQAGFDEGYVDSIDVTLADDKQKCGPECTAIKTKKPVIVDDIATNPLMSAWRENALHHHYLSMAAFPLINNNGDVFAVLSVYSATTNAFGIETMNILEEMIGDLSFGIMTLRARTELQKVSERLDRSMESARDAIIIMGPDERISFWNKAAEEIFGYTKEEVLGQLLHEILALAPDIEAFKRGFSEFQKTGTGPIVGTVRQLTALRKNGEEFPIELSVSSTNLDGKWYATGIVRDVTEQKKAEKEIAEREKHSESLLRISKGMERAQTYGEVLGTAQEEVKNVIGYKNLWAYLFTEDKKFAHSIVAGGPESDIIMSEKGAATLTIKGDRMLEEIASAKEIVVVEDAQKDERVNKEIVAKLGNRTIVNVPVILFDQLLGSVGMGTFCDEGVRVPSPSEQKYLVAMASHMAVSFDRIRLLIDRKISETKIRNLSNLYATLSLCNQAIVHSNNKEELFIRVCRAAVQTEGFKMAWIGEVDKKNDVIVPISSYGDTQGYLDNIRISTREDDPFGRGPTGVAFREAKPYWCQDFQNDPNTTPWREKGKLAEWGSTAALPIFQKGEVVYTITLYATTVSGFNEAEQNLLVEMASDISFALDTFIDRAKREQMEDEIAEEKAEDEATMASLGEGIFSVDKNGVITTINHRAEEMTGWREADIVGKVLTTIIPAIDEAGNIIPSEERPISIVLSTRTPYVSDTLRLIKKNGDTIPVAATATPTLLNNKLIGAVVIFRDITKEKEIEKTRGDLLALASHQLRTPLSGTKWLIETLQRGLKGPLNKEQKEYLNEIYGINERMTSLVGDMLGVLRMESGTIPANKKLVFTKEIIDPLFETFTPVAKREGVTLEKQQDGEYMIETDPVLLRNIIECFVSNAINYSTKGGRVNLSAKQEGEEFVFSVKDSGIGIPKDEQGQLFQRFYRASNAKTWNTKGTGLGLYIAATLAKKIGAKLSFESEVGKGTTFHVHIPYVSKKHESIATK